MERVILFPRFISSFLIITRKNRIAKRVRQVSSFSFGTHTKKNKKQKKNYRWKGYGLPSPPAPSKITDLISTFQHFDAYERTSMRACLRAQPCDTLIFLFASRTVDIAIWAWMLFLWVRVSSVPLGLFGRKYFSRRIQITDGRLKFLRQWPLCYAHSHIPILEPFHC